MISQLFIHPTKSLISLIKEFWQRGDMQLEIAQCPTVQCYNGKMEILQR